MKNFWKILLIVDNEQIIDEINNIVKNDTRFSVVNLYNRSRFIEKTIQMRPDIIVIENNLVNTPLDIAVVALKSLDEMADTRIVFFTNDKENCVEHEADACYEISEVSRELLADMILEQIGVPPDKRKTFINIRRWTRKPVNVPARFEYYLSPNDETYFYGETVIKNISKGGTCIEKLGEDYELVNLEEARIRLYADTFPLENWKSVAKIVRTENNTYGLQFVNLTDNNLKKIDYLPA